MLPLSFFAFIAFGWVLVLVGANQAELARDLALDLTHTGLLASLLALGIGIGVVVAGPIFDRCPRRPLFVASTLIAATALLSVEQGMSYERWLFHIGLAGFGIGLYDTLINAAVVEIYDRESARPMSLLHAGASLGAVLGPLLVVWIQRHGPYTASFLAAGGAHLALAVWASRVPLPSPPERPPGHAPWRAVLSPALLPFAAVAFAYVGVESAVTIFAVPYATDGLGIGEARGQLGISAFWLGLLGGRLGIVALRTALDAKVLLAAGIGGSVVLAAGVLGELEVVELTLLGVGAALGCVYPLMIALAGQRFPQARGTAAGLAAGVGAIGGFAVPWITGAVGDATTVTWAFASLSLWCVTMAAAAAIVRHARSR